MYPEHKAKFYEIGAMVGRARVLQGVHYQSDNDAAMIMTRLLWANIKENLAEKWSNLIREEACPIIKPTQYNTSINRL